MKKTKCGTELEAFITRFSLPGQNEKDLKKDKTIAQLKSLLALEANHLVGPVIIYSLDHTSYKNHYISDSFYRITGACEASASREGLPYLLSYKHPDYLKVFLTNVYPQLIACFLEMPTEERLKSRAQFNYKLRLKDGSYLPCIQYCMMLELDENQGASLEVGIIRADNFPSQENQIILMIDQLTENGVYKTIFRKEYQFNGEKSLFSRRENEILTMIRSGMSINDIANNFFLSVHTVRNHKRSMFKKAGVVRLSALLKFEDCNFGRN